MKLSTVFALVAALVLAAGASAQSPADTVYNPNNEVLNVVTGSGDEDDDGAPTGVAGGDGTPPVQQEVGTTPVAQAPPPAGNLPFTGFEAGLVAVAGLALLGGGFAMRRFSRGEA